MSTIPAIENGTVIDHIDPDQVLKVMEALRLTEEQVSLGINVASASMKRKAFLKVHDRHLTPDETSQLAILSPQATISIIENFEVTSKQEVEIPQSIQGLFPCSNPRCITNHEPVEPSFSVRKRKNQTLLRCHYCEKTTA